MRHVRRDTASASLLLDAGLAVLALGFALIFMAGGQFAPSDGGRGLDALGVALALGMSAPLLARRAYPASAFALTIAATSATYGLGYSLGPAIGAVIAFYTVAAASEGGSTRRARIGVSLVGLAALAAVHLSLRPGPEGFLGILVFTAAWFGGDWTRRRREHMAELEERSRRAEREAERERQLEIAEERTRIARDLHDSAGHAIGVILMQAGAARLLRDRAPEAAADALKTVETVARETIADIDRIVGALRDESPPDSPSLGLAALPDLLRRYEGDGQGVELIVRGHRRPLPALAERAAYRILQEGLTNAARHGDGGAAVVVSYEEEAIEVEISNDRDGDRGQPREGHGLLGMRERAQMLGGSLEVAAGSRRFVVRARIPCESP